MSRQTAEIARSEHGAQAQRIQPIGKYAGQIDLTSFEHYRDLPELNELLQKVLTPDHIYGDLDRIGVLLEPQDEPWCTNWHRDWRDHIPLECFEDEFEDDWMQDSMDMHKMLQINCPLYEDHSTWFVPDNHIRRRIPKLKNRCVMPARILILTPCRHQLPVNGRVSTMCAACPMRCSFV
jgi:hypothetical protein